MSTAGAGWWQVGIQRLVGGVVACQLMFGPDALRSMFAQESALDPFG